MKGKVFILLLVLFIFGSCSKKKSIENKKAIWIKNAFTTLESNNYPKVKAISWWHEDFDNSFLKVNSSIESLNAYRKAISSPTFITKAKFKSNKLVVPTSGIYHSAFPDFGGTEDIVTEHRITDFENIVGKKIVWVYFSNNWYNKIQFPSSEVNIIKATGKTPFIRIMPRTNFDEGVPDPNYTMQNIIDGKYDNQLVQWAIDASKTNIPLLVEFGTEVNGNWFPWNAQYNGAETKTEYGNPLLFDGAERFRDAYIHIIDIFNMNGAENITWFFHINAYNEPETEWNKFINYYPGDEYIDWLGISVYGPQESDEEYQNFEEILNDIYTDLTMLSDRPIAILEFAITEIN